jgi:microsomal dipeptidase-like Zn-dependent dipeptidase
MKWILVILTVVIVAFFVFAPAIVERGMNKLAGSGQWPVSAQAAALHKKLTVIDMHSDTLLWKRDLDTLSDQGHVDLPRLEAGNVALQVFSSVTKTPKGQNYEHNSADSDNITLLAVVQLQPVRTWNSLLERSLWHAEKLRRAETASDGRLRIIRSATDFGRLLHDRAAGKRVTGALLSVEGLQNLEGKLANVQTLYDAGFRMAGLAHFFDNDIAGSMHGMTKGGLTPLGRQVVAALEAHGMLVDLAHASPAAFAETLAMAKRPVVVSHGGVKATCNTTRNLSDDQLRALSANGGVIGIGYWDAAVCTATPAAVAAAIKHVRDLVGVQYVGLGSDFDGSTTVGFDTAHLAAVTQALRDSGFSDAEITAVMGGNVARVLQQGLPK